MIAEKENDEAGRLGAGLLLGGVLAAMIVDAAVLAREPVPEKQAKLTVLPGSDPRTRSASIAVFGSF